MERESKADPNKVPTESHIAEQGSASPQGPAIVSNTHISRVHLVPDHKETMFKKLNTNPHQTGKCLF